MQTEAGEIEIGIPSVAEWWIEQLSTLIIKSIVIVVIQLQQFNTEERGTWD